MPHLIIKITSDGVYCIGAPDKQFQPKSNKNSFNQKSNKN